MVRRSEAGLTITDTGTLDVEDLLQEVAEGQGGQRVSAEIGEMRIGCDVGAGRAQQGGGGAAHGVQHRCLRTVAPQFTQLVGLPFGQLGVEPAPTGRRSRPSGWDGPACGYRSADRSPS